MLDHILNTTQTFVRTHGTAPDVIFINPSHYESLYKHHAELFQPNQDVHPKAARLDVTRNLSRVA